MFWRRQAAQQPPDDEQQQQPEQPATNNIPYPQAPAQQQRSIYLRTNYAAACPTQHLAYLHCKLSSRVPWACSEEQAAFETCQALARALADPLNQTSHVPAWKLHWANIRHSPFWGELRTRVGAQMQGYAAALGHGGGDSDGSGESGSSSSSGGGGQAGTS
jgi:uncharacterized membrane protein YgcG